LISLQSMTKGRVMQNCGGTLPFSGIAFYNLLPLKSVFTTSIKLPIYTAGLLVFLVSKFTKQHTQLNELPARTVAPAHWSGPLVAVR